MNMEEYFNKLQQMANENDSKSIPKKVPQKGQITRDSTFMNNRNED